MKSAIRNPKSAIETPAVWSLRRAYAPSRCRHPIILFMSFVKNTTDIKSSLSYAVIDALSLRGGSFLARRLRSFAGGYRVNSGLYAGRVEKKKRLKKKAHRPCGPCGKKRHLEGTLWHPNHKVNCRQKRNLSRPCGDRESF
jgi:hypothetical protein